MYFLQSAWFHDEEAAYRFVESRIWPDGPVCPHCGESERIGRLRGVSTRIGTYKCYGCRKPFTVKIGTILESTHLPLHRWLRAIVLMALSSRDPTLRDLEVAMGATPRAAAAARQRLAEAIAEARTVAS